MANALKKSRICVDRSRARCSAPPSTSRSDALKGILDHYRQNRNDGEKFNDFVDRVGVAPFEEIFSQFKEEIGPLDRDHINTYMDWGKTVLYKLERGEGECAV